ncbi:hypothetical protein [Bradyrhizobium manausense]|uniref:hypothetical protein n=1 Tax=Bradyrhizobium manausense TaxID=989370 RepID=UPI0012EDF8BD|nr:hypothetical protein [Bradyrhizobium manausense]
MQRSLNWCVRKPQPRLAGGSAATLSGASINSGNQAALVTAVLEGALLVGPWAFVPVTEAEMTSP